MAERDPLVIRVLNEYRAGLLAGESQQFGDLGRRWGRVLDSLENSIAALAEDVAALGPAAPRWKIEALGRYRALLAQVEREIQRFGFYADDVITRDQIDAAATGLEAAAQAIDAVYMGAGKIAPSFSRLNVSAVEAMAGFASDGSPLRDLLLKSYPATTEAILDSLVRSMATGTNPNVIARGMSDALGVPLARAKTIARSEKMRAYRSSTLEQYRESEVVRMYSRLASKSLRTCIACLMADGRVYALRTEFEEHPNGRCTMVPIVLGVPAVQWLTGREWFEMLEGEQQRKIMGEARWELWQKTNFDLAKVIKRRNNPIWGAALTPRPVRELAEL